MPYDLPYIVPYVDETQSSSAPAPRLLPDGYGGVPPCLVQLDLVAGRAPGITNKEKKILTSISILMIIMKSILYFSVRFHFGNMLLLMILIPGIPPL